MATFKETRTYDSLEKRKTPEFIRKASDIESVPAQIALEDSHDIQYRTCSWQKARITSLVLAFLLTSMFHFYLDSGAAIRRVHMPSHYVVSLVSELAR